MNDDFLKHHDNPLTPEEFQRIHDAIVTAGRRRLVGRRFIELYGPMGPGVQAIPYDEFTNAGDGQLDLVGESASDPVFTDQRRFRTIPLLYKDFLLHWRDLEMVRQLNMPLDVSAAAGAGPISISATASQGTAMRSEEQASYATRSSFLAMWSVYLEDPTSPSVNPSTRGLPTPFAPRHRAAYERFFQRYGSHVVKRVFIGTWRANNAPSKCRRWFAQPARILRRALQGSPSSTLTVRCGLTFAIRDMLANPLRWHGNEPREYQRFPADHLPDPSRTEKAQ